MKLELKTGESEQPREHSSLIALPESRDVASIDISQVLAANQALLKNLSMKLESVENKLVSLETLSRKQIKAGKLEYLQRKLLLEAPKQVKAWEPEYPRVDDGYLSKFSFFDRLFRPEKLRRKGAE